MSSVSVSNSKKRLALDVIGQLEEAVESNPLDHGKWSKLIKQVLAKDKEEQVRQVFDKYLSIFKFDGNQWSSYINYELSRGEFQRVEQLFPRCLTITENVELCRLYVSYVRRVNDVITGGEKARGVVIQAFEFAVNKVGIDISSGPLWNDYLEFLKSWTPGASWEQQQKIDLIRKVYKRCLTIPTEQIENMWTVYTKWENEINSATASKFIAEKSTAFMDARSWNTEWHNITSRSLKREIIPFGLNSKETELVSSQLQLWFNWLKLEEKNKLNLKDEVSVRHRIEYVYKQASATLPLVPEIWFRYTKFLLAQNEEANLSKCIELNADAIKLNNHSFLLAFQLSEMYEKDNSYNKASSTLHKLIDVYVADDNALSEQVEDILQKKGAKGLPVGASEVKDSSEEPADKESDEDGGISTKNGDAKEEDDEDAMDDASSHNTPVQFTEAESDQLLELHDKRTEMSKLITLIYTKLMMLSKRSQGIKEARIVFKQARDSYKSLGFELYTESALMEYYSDKQKTADKIFKLAMKGFSRNGEFLLSYLNYLILTNAVESIKVFFESAVTNLLKDITSDKEELSHVGVNLYNKKFKTRKINQNQYFMRKIIKTYIKFATNYLDIDTVKSLENRYEQFFPDDDPLELFGDRYKSNDFDVIKKYDLVKQDVEEEVDPELLRSVKKRRLETKSDNYTPEPGTLDNTNTVVPSKPPSNTNQNGFVGKTVYTLLQTLPNAGYFGPPPEHVFNTSKLVELFSNLPDIPDDL